MALPPVELRPLTRADLPLVSRWLAEPLVARWWHDDPSPAAVEAQFGPSIDGTDPTRVYLGVRDGEPFGLVQVYRFADEPGYTAELATVCPVPDGALSIDYLVGEPGARGRGLGTAMIAAAVARGFADHPDAQDVLVPVALGNERSWRALERAGATRYAVGELVPDNPVDPRDHVVHRFTRARGDAAAAPAVPD
ncbi:GNAT family N-acetyltransferase [Modestobacter sp. NPDC049651]|uniref:GNAT family N-acetyltransferase n=1 Tax=unclassified Modestobacter TaxID=2643866 RepID=UPI0033F13966